DPTRPYTAGSPWSGSWDHHPNDPDHGTYHSWEVWNRQDYTDYRDNVPRFVSEFGWQAPPAMATLRRALPGEDLAPDSPGMLHHQKAEDGNGKLNRGIERHFAPPQGDFDRWHYLTQVVQARAVATGIEHWRANWPRCAGTIVWQLNDCWPVSSWSAVDGDGRLKPLHHELRRVYADRLLTLQPGADGTDLVLANQGATAWETTVNLRLMRTDGTLAARLTLDLTAPPREVLRLAVPPEVLPATGSAKEYLVADSDELRALHLPVRDREFDYPEPRYDVAVETVGSDRNTVDVVISAQTLVRDLLLQPDRITPHATADRGLITLLPGERTRIRVHGAQGAGANTVRAALFCVEPA
ncbi:glycoside hydrolase family 2 protein, partial [Streptomyces sp. NPDC059900]